MLKLFKECVPWLNWQTGLIAALAIVGIVVCTGLPSWSFLAGATPLLLIAACLIPCLVPLALLRKNKGATEVTVDSQPK
jgi:hypothetical protein